MQKTTSFFDKRKRLTYLHTTESIKRNVDYKRQSCKMKNARKKPTIDMKMQKHT